MKTILPIICFLLLVYPAAVSIAKDKPAPEIKANEKLVYKTIDGHKLQLHIFKPKNHRATDKRAAIVFFFGGSWARGTPSQFYPHCQYLASRGMVAISAEYRVRKIHNTSPFECVADGKSAIRWIRQHAKQLGLDPEHIAAGGGSAGGHVAAATGTLTAFDEKGEDLSISSIPNALVLFNPVFDNRPKGYGHKGIKKRWREFSPMHNISKKTPSTIVFLGTKDKLIPVATAKKYQQLMKQAGGRCDLHLYKKQSHGFFNYRRKGNKYYRQTVIAMDKFLASQGYLSGQPTMKE